MNTETEKTPSRSPSPAAERARSYRRRRRRGLRCVRLQIGRAQLDGLVAKGYLGPGDRQDVHAIAMAIDNLIFDWLSRT